MKAIHINGTAPFRMRNPRAEYTVQDFDLLTTILSALEWKRLNGTIQLYADYTAAEYYSRMGLLDLWDKVDTDVLDRIPSSINQDIFWAASKLFALQAEQEPSVMIDMDLIVWKPIGDLLERADVLTFHDESVDAECYPPSRSLKTRNGYQFDPEWDWTVNPCNNALVYIRDTAFKNRYTEKAIDFMTNNLEYAQDMVSQMVFAEQRILAMSVVKEGRKMSYCLRNPFQKDNDTFTHLWGGKSMAMKDPEYRQQLCWRLVKKIKKNYPEYYRKVSDMEIFKEYCK